MATSRYTFGFFGSTTPVSGDNPVVGDLWVDTSGAPPDLKICTSTSPVTFASEGGPPTGSAGGELGGTYPNPTVNATHSGSAHHTQSHDHSAAGDGTALAPATLTVPGSATPAQTAEGSVVWDTDGDLLTIGDAVGRKTFVPASAMSGDATQSDSGAVTVAATHSGSAHHTQSHNHSAAGDGTALTPASVAPSTFLTLPNGAGGPTIDAVGKAGVDTTSRTVNFHDGTAEVILNPVYQVRFLIESPVAGDDLAFAHIRSASTIIETDYLCVGGTNWVGQVQEADSNGANPADTQAADTTATAGTNAQVTSYSNAGIDAGDYLYLKTTSISGTPTWLVVTVYLRQNA